MVLESVGISVQVPTICIGLGVQSSNIWTQVCLCVHKDAIFGHWRIHIHGDAHHGRHMVSLEETNSDNA